MGGGAWVRAVCEGMSGVCEIPACFKLPRALGEGALDSPMVCTGRTKGVGRTVGVCVCVRWLYVGGRVGDSLSLLHLCVCLGMGFIVYS